MNHTPTLVLPPRHSVDTQLLWKAAIAAEWRIERLSSWHAPEWLREANPVLYGEPLFVAAVADALELEMIEPDIDWLVHLPSNLLKRKLQFTDLETAKSITTQSFIKPAAEKSFPAKVYETSCELEKAVEGLDESTPVLVSDPVCWIVEFRCFLLGRQLLTLSPYARFGEVCETSEGLWPATDEEFEQAVGFLQRVLDDTNAPLPSGVVVDVGLIENAGWALIEANAAWGSGIYGCDPNEVLKVIQTTSIRKNK